MPVQEYGTSTSYVDGIAFGTRTRRVGVRQEPLCCGFATAGAEIGRPARRVSKNHFGKIAQGSSGNTPTSTNKLLETKSDLQSFCGCETSFCLTTENPIIASPGETNSL
jgi:hypothetical protein